MEIIPDEQGQNSEKDGECEDDAVEKAQHGIANDEKKLSLTEILRCSTVVVWRFPCPTVCSVVHIDASTEKGKGIEGCHNGL